MADVQAIDPDALGARARAAFGDAAGPVLDALARTRALDDAAAWRRAMALADQLLDLRLDPVTVTAAVLVAGVAERDAGPVLREAFGAEVAGLLEAVGRLAHIRWEDLQREATENLRKMFLALASDVRGVLIALADRVHTMRDLEKHTDPERRRLARETMEVYAPLANRLGVWQLKWELEDLAFREMQPQTYREIGKLLAEKRAARRDAIDEVQRVLGAEVAAAGIEAKITGRPKHIFSIYKKMQRKGLGFDRIYDVLAVRVLVKEVAECYAVLGLVHGRWAPIPGEFDDYIARPKANDYRSLHTAVVGPGGRNVEVQIRTFEMHELSEYGIAAHWQYKEGGKKAGRAFDEKINWLRQLMEWHKEVTDLHDLAESLKSDIFKDQVYVFTPGGEVVDLPQGATPIDFAYRIHTMVGHRCRGAKVDGQIVPLDYELQTGQRVEIITAKEARPSRDWLNPHLGYVKSAGARQKIRQWYRAQQRDASVASGRELVEREIKRLGVESRSIDEVAKLCGADDVEEFLAKLGFGDLSPQHVATRLLEAEAQRKAAAAPPKPLRAPVKRKAPRVSIGGIDDVMSAPARCCHPVPGDAVVGFITRGRGLMIHRADCPNLQNIAEPERLMDVDWSPAYDQLVPVEIAVVAHDRAGLLRDIADVVAAEGVNMSAASADPRKGDGIATLRATLEIRQAEQLVRVLARIERLPYVQTARRVAG
jgi:RelA/SpoT family (p)ppGpp synthetase